MRIRSNSALTLTIAALAWLPAPSASAQEPMPVAGTRVRVTERVRPRRPNVGTLVALGPDSIRYRLTGDSAARSLALAHVARLEVSRGTHRHIVRRTLVGGALGFACGYGLAYALGNARGPLVGITARDHAAGIGAALAVIGAATSAVGSALAPSEDWGQVPLTR